MDIPVFGFLEETRAIIVSLYVLLVWPVSPI